jgi:hypothetical protein
MLEGFLLLTLSIPFQVRISALSFGATQDLPPSAVLFSSPLPPPPSVVAPSDDSSSEDELFSRPSPPTVPLVKRIINPKILAGGDGPSSLVNLIDV